MELEQWDDACKTLSAGMDRNPKSNELHVKFQQTKGLAKVGKELRTLKSSHRHQDILNLTDGLGEYKDKRIYLARASAHLALSHYREAILDADQVLHEESQNLTALLIRAKAKFLGAQLDDALEDCHRALEVDPQHISVGDLCSLAKRVQKMYNMAEEAMTKQTYKQASSLYGMAIHETDSLPKESELYRRLYLGRAEANLKAGNHMQALANINLVIEAQLSYDDNENNDDDEEEPMSALKVSENMASELEAVVAKLKARKPK